MVAGAHLIRAHVPYGDLAGLERSREDVAPWVPSAAHAARLPIRHIPHKLIPLPEPCTEAYCHGYHPTSERYKQLSCTWQLPEFLRE